MGSTSFPRPFPCPVPPGKKALGTRMRSLGWLSVFVQVSYCEQKLIFYYIIIGIISPIPYYSMLHELGGQWTPIKSLLKHRQPKLSGFYKRNVWEISFREDKNKASTYCPYSSVSRISLGWILSDFSQKVEHTFWEDLVKSLKTQPSMSKLYNFDNILISRSNEISYTSLL